MNENIPENNGELFICQSEDGKNINVKLDGDTVWLTQAQLVELY